MSSTDNIYFHCYGGTHSSIVAAAIRCNLLPKRPVNEVWDLVWFDRLAVPGLPVFIGTDKKAKVFALARRSYGRWVDEVMPVVLRACGGRAEFIDAGAATSMLMKAGGLLTQRLGWNRPGRWLLTRGINQAWRDLARLADREVTAEVSQLVDKVIVWVNRREMLDQAPAGWNDVVLNCRRSRVSWQDQHGVRAVVVSGGPGGEWTRLLIACVVGSCLKSGSVRVVDAETVDIDQLEQVIARAWT